jgi:hypothetical protein
MWEGGVALRLYQDVCGKAGSSSVRFSSSWKRPGKTFGAARFDGTNRFEDDNIGHSLLRYIDVTW